jgi:chromosomal replication initiator protein
MASSWRGRGEEADGSPVLGGFLAGPENRLAVVAVESLLDDTASDYAPIVLVGPSGTGKTHLARGICDAWRDRFPQRRAVYVTAADFAHELDDSIKAQAIDDFHRRYRQASLVVFEDVQHLASKRMDQDELLYTLDAVLCSGGRFVATASTTPEQIRTLSPALKSRLVSGLVVPLAPPGPQVRLTLIRELAVLGGLELSGRVARLLAKRLATTVPELLGALVQLERQAERRGRAIALDDAARFLAGRSRAQAPPFKDIAAATARHFRLRASDLRSRSQRSTVVRARAVAMYLARSLTRQSLGQIGDYFGHRDHTTVLHGCRKVEQLIKTDPDVREAVGQLQQKWQTAQDRR